MSTLPFDPASQRYVSLATFRRDGSEVLTPVWIAPSGGSYFVFSEGEAWKVKRVRATPRARIAPCDARGKVSGPWIEMRAGILADETISRNAYAALRSKYGWQMALLDFFSGISGKKNKRALIELQPLGG